jgi:hypothetical protein
MGTHCADQVTPLYPQKLALTSPTGGGRSVGIVRSRTKATEFSFSHHHTVASDMSHTYHCDDSQNTKRLQWSTLQCYLQPCSNHWHFSICSTVAPRLLSWHRSKWCQLFIARVWLPHICMPCTSLASQVLRKVS